MTAPGELAARRAHLIRNVAIGLPAFLSLLVALYVWLPRPGDVDTVLGRLVLALRCDAVAALPLLAGIQTVASLRGRSEAIDPLAGKDPPNLQVHGRYIQNTLEQLTLFVVGTAALATYLDADTARVLPALAAVFFLARLVFWRGYLKNPLTRGAGMAGTFLVNYVVFGAVLYFTVRTVLAV